MTVLNQTLCKSRALSITVACMQESTREKSDGLLVKRLYSSKCLKSE